MQYIVSLLSGSNSKDEENESTQREEETARGEKKRRKRQRDDNVNEKDKSNAKSRHQHIIDPDDLIGQVPYRTAKSMGDLYTQKQKLGTGQFGAVYLGICKKSKKRVAYKSMKHFKGLQSMEKKKVQQICNEIVAMELANKLKSPNIIELLAVVETNTEIYMVMEPMEGGELFDRIVQRHHFSEYDAASILRVICITLQAMHKSGIVHRDIKPENLLYKSAHKDSPLKIIDFGLARIRGRADPYAGRIVGTPGYFAPESFLRKQYSEKCDTYSLGVVLYILLSGFPPFGGEKTTAELCDSMAKEDYEMGKWGWENISEEAKDLVQSMLKADPAKRISLELVMRHKWAHPDVENRKIHLAGTVTRMVTWNARRKLRSAIRAVMTAHRLGHIVSENSETIQDEKSTKTKRSSCKKAKTSRKSSTSSKRRSS